MKLSMVEKLKAFRERIAAMDGDEFVALFEKHKVSPEVAKTYAFLEAALSVDPFSCCGGNDDHPPEHTMDCETRKPVKVRKKRRKNKCAIEDHNWVDASNDGSVDHCTECEWYFNNLTGEYF